MPLITSLRGAEERGFLHGLMIFHSFDPRGWVILISKMVGTWDITEIHTSTGTIEEIHENSRLATLATPLHFLPLSTRISKQTPCVPPL